MGGRVVLINGTPACGKTTLTRSLQEALHRRNEWWLTLHIDEFVTMSAQAFFGVPGGAAYVERAGGAVALEFGPGIRPLVDAIAHGAVACAKAGLDVIVDTVVFDHATATLWGRLLEDVDAVRVGLVAPLEVLEERARQRERNGYPPVGLTKMYFDIVHQHMTYDVTIDTSVEQADASAERLAALLLLSRSAS